MIIARRDSCPVRLNGRIILLTSALVIFSFGSPKASELPGNPQVIQTNDAQRNWCEAAFKIPSGPPSPNTQVSGKEEKSFSPGSNSERQPILALSLSGGGYRAMLFHVGTLRRLNDSDLLPLISVVSSVSGGSVTAAYLAHRWNDLTFDAAGHATNFAEVVETPLRRLAQETLDITSILTGLLPFTSSSNEQVKEFDKHLFHGALLADIAPGGSTEGTRRPRPLFILNATNLQTGELWQLRSSAIGGPITQWTAPGKVRLSEAVAASSGFPPFLSPLIIELPDIGNKSVWYDCSDYRDNPHGIHYRNEPGRVLPQDSEALMPYRKKVYLVDGGVRDNLGISTLEDMNRLRRLSGINQSTVTLISDGGATTQFEGDPSANWSSQLFRVLNLLADQPDEVRIATIIRTSALRLRRAGWNATETSDACPSADIPLDLEKARLAAVDDQYADAYAYWSIRRRPKLHRGFECPTNIPQWMLGEVRALSSVPTAFRAMPDDLQARLINWGYLAAHHGIPYVDAAWTELETRKRWLGRCALPYGPEITDPKGESTSARDARCLGFASSTKK